MKKLRCVIVDDEINSSDVIKAQINRHFPHIQIAAICNNSVQSVSIIEEHEPDILFLDIEMPNMNGFEVLDAVGDKSFETIFITAYNNFAIEAFKKNAIGYILKPIDRMDFIQTVLMAVLRITNQMPREVNSNLAVLNKEVKIALPINGSQDVLSIADIYYVKADGSYSKFYTSRGTYLISKNLRHVESAILQHQFVRVNRSYLINTQSISNISKKEGGTITMTDGTQISISQRVKDEVFDSLGDSIILIQ